MNLLADDDCSVVDRMIAGYWGVPEKNLMVDD